MLPGRRAEVLSRVHAPPELCSSTSQSSSSSVRNLPVPGLRAAKKKKATLNRTRGSMSLIGTPVSMFSCARAPFPVMISPMMEKAIPSCASLPTKSSFAFVNPNRGPSQMDPLQRVRIRRCRRSRRQSEVGLTSFFETQGRSDALAGGDDGLLEPSGGVIDEAPTVSQSSNGAEEGEEDEEEEQRLCLVDGDTGLQIQLGENPLPRDSFPEKRRLQPRRLIKTLIPCHPRRYIDGRRRDRGLTAKPIMATRPTKSSLALVKPMPPDVPKIPSSTLGFGLAVSTCNI